MLILLTALKFLAAKSQVSGYSVSTDPGDGLYNIEPEDNLSISTSFQDDLIAETDPSAHYSSDDLLDKIFDINAQKRSLSPSQHVKRQVCRSKKSPGSTRAAPDDTSTGLERKPVPKAQTTGFNPCQGSARGIHVSCGGQYNYS